MCVAGGQPAGAYDSDIVEQDPGQDAAYPSQVPLPIQHARAEQGVPGRDPCRKGQVRHNLGVLQLSCPAAASCSQLRPMYMC